MNTDDSLVQSLTVRVDESRDRLERLRAELADKQREVATAEEQLRAYEGALRAERAQFDPAPSPQATSDGPAGTAELSLEGMDAIAAAVEVLRSAGPGAELHADEIIGRMQARGWSSQAKDVMTATRLALSRAQAKPNAPIARAGRGTYTLAELRFLSSGDGPHSG
jgi:hypothetical protein